MKCLRLIPLLLLASVLVAWPLSYWRAAAVVIPGCGGVAIDTGAFFVAGRDTVSRSSGITFETYPPEFPMESLMGGRVNRWLPVRALSLGNEHILIVAAWVPAAVLAVPAVWAMRRSRVAQTRGFELKSIGGIT